ncbi:MAG: polysaccharide pyruvyl transferase family protein [Dehalococcoidia bacterium]|nr:MAG: polysaccharide pyruvyl transferase family protein [Dehalococcoidia bacterium]
MKVSILTQPLGSNYGGIMQAWALQKVLKCLGHEPIIIDRQPDPPVVSYKIARLAYRALLKARGRRKAPVNFEKYFPIIFQQTRSFIFNHIVISEPLYSTRQLKDHFDRKKYDAVIVGSDQTWRPKYSPNIYNYFLDFLEDKNIIRIAYASSFGVDDWEFTDEQTQTCAELAGKFKAVSVREDSGIRLCRRYLKVNAVHVLDPTLLIEKKDYIELIGKERLKKDYDGIFTYFLDKTLEKLQIAKILSEELGEPVYSCQSSYSLNADFPDIDGYIMPDVRDWLSGFANAKFVLTDSFHGMVLSLIFGKPFFVMKNKARGAARFTSLLTACGLERQILDESQLDNPSNLARALMNLSLNDSAFFAIRENSRRFLMESLSQSF